MTTAAENTQLATLARSRRPKAHAHWWISKQFFTSESYGHGVGGGTVTVTEVCDLCGITRADYEARQRRGRLNRTRGNRIQRERNQALGIRNLAGNTPSLDGVSALFATESKSGGAFPERLWRWLKGVKLITADQVAILIVTDAPGSARKARSIVVVDYEDWRSLHGEVK